MTRQPSPEPGASPGLEARLSRLEAQVATLADAIRALAHGLENVPSQDTPPEETARGARLAHELLISQDL
ncbi:hypothetical protein [Streptomyces colonosanans]|uniref:Uncharacterized protein n=1 Tax=Streptomyces colonosanans TaxID=1428652 RepID=A0A1S2PLE0_9ACTN|nr:hypothetical protein [Streptomyces colonosanans]OIJ94607.1 hypothetical protein BIV24_10675 [Streptomyces colonosanans]